MKKNPLLAVVFMICGWLSITDAAGQDEDWAEYLDLSKIPPAVDRKVDFRTEVWPLLDKHCLSCHGLKKPKNDYQLTSRELAINSGDYGDNIIVGDGLKSPLLHYASHAEEDMEMPPIGKGDPIPKEGLAVIRAWIDQGLEWSEVKPQIVSVNVASEARIWWVDGNKNMFRQLHGFREDDSVGLSSISLSHPTEDGGEWYVDGSVWTHPDEFKVIVGYDQPVGMWFEAGMEQWISYDSTVGGYAPDFANSFFLLPGRLERTHQNIGFKWGIRSEDGPSLTVGYEFMGVDGFKAITSFGEAAEDINGNYVLRSIRPGDKVQDNETHRLTLTLASHEDAELLWEDEVTLEWQRLDEAREEFGAFTSGAANPEQRLSRRESWDSFRGSNALRMEKMITDDWRLSLGHSFSLMEGESVFAENTVGLTNPFSFQGPVSQGIILNQHNQMGNVNLSGGPWDNHISVTGGLQFDWLTQDGEGAVIPFPGAAPQRLDSGWDQTRFSEFFRLRYTGLNRQVLYGEAHFRQMSYDQSEFLDTNINRMTEANHDRHQFTAGWRHRPSSSVGLHLRGRYSGDTTDYSHPLDQKFGGAGVGYPAFIRDRESDTFDIEGRVSWTPHRQVRLENQYQWSTTDYKVSTDSARDFNGALITPGGSVDSSEYDMHTLGSSISWTPHARVNALFHGHASRWDMSSEANGFPGVSDYTGWTWWAGTRWSWVINQKTDVSASYDLSRADFSDGTSGFAFASGLDYQWQRAGAGIRYRLRDNLTTFAEYGFSIWDQPSIGGINDFEAHGIFFGFNWKLEVEKSSEKPE